MHACGHDVHMTWGLAVLEAIADSDFAGRLVVFFQPAEETGGGGHPMAESAYARRSRLPIGSSRRTRSPDRRGGGGDREAAGDGAPRRDDRGDLGTRGKAPNEGDNAMQAMGNGDRERLRDLDTLRV